MSIIIETNTPTGPNQVATENRAADNRVANVAQSRMMPVETASRTSLAEKSLKVVMLGGAVLINLIVAPFGLIFILLRGLFDLIGKIKQITS